MTAVAPHRSRSPWDEDVLEWWCGPRKLTVYVNRVEPERSTYIKVSGPDSADMVDGPYTPDMLDDLTAWVEDNE